MTNRGADFDGEHRHSDPQAPGDPAGASSGPDLGAGADYRTLAEEFARAYGAARAFNCTMMPAGMYPGYMMSPPPSLRADPPKLEIPNAGIRAGEIIGYRAWRVQSPDSLTSMHMEHYTWAPGQVHHSSDVYRGDGFYAFDAPDLVVQEFNPLCYSTPVVYGTIAMWGEVVEHERGWRAEYAAIKSFDKISSGIFKWRTLRRLRKTFGVQR